MTVYALKQYAKDVGNTAWNVFDALEITLDLSWVLMNVFFVYLKQVLMEYILLVLDYPFVYSIYLATTLDMTKIECWKIRNNLMLLMTRSHNHRSLFSYIKELLMHHHCKILSLLTQSKFKFFEMIYKIGCVKVYLKESTILWSVVCRCATLRIIIHMRLSFNDWWSCLKIYLRLRYGLGSQKYNLTEDGKK